VKDPFARPDALRLKPIEVEGWPAPIDLVRGKLTLGRAAENDVALPAGSFPAVSGRHARVEQREGKLWVIDLGSRNGTLVNGERVTERALGPGDIVRLGPVGPRFMVTGRKALEQTVFVDPRAVGLSREVSKEDVVELVAAGGRRSRRRALGLGALGALAVTLLCVDLFRARNRDAHDRDELAQVGIELEQRLEAELTTTRAELEGALTRFDHADARDADATRLAGVAAVRRAVVLIESRIVLRHRETGALLHEELVGFSYVPNFDGRGEVWMRESTGSGFCIDAEGTIVTNRHVVAVPEDDEVLRATRGLPIEPELELLAVFSGESLRHPVTVVGAAEGDLDLALVRIPPFEGLPFIGGLDLDAPSPDPGTDIYLLGFPLGHFALQEGERVIASTFRGILSRVVGGQIQVDAGVHPGNSGGPITDPAGRVIGVVCSVQSLPDHSAVYTIGYGIPVAELRGLLASRGR
jgi:S1-C subfamily serine protease